MALSTAAGPRWLIGAGVWSVPARQLAGRYGGERDQAVVGDRPSREETLGQRYGGFDPRTTSRRARMVLARERRTGSGGFSISRKRVDTETEEAPVEEGGFRDC
jgi:hypothetical protein